MKRIAATLLLTALLTTTGSQMAQAGPQQAPCQERSWTDRSLPRAEIEWRIVRIVSCAVKRWPVVGGARFALGIAWRESHYTPWAYNPSGCGGVFQHMLRYWPGRVRAYLEPAWFPRTWPDVPWWNARANIIVAIRMAHAGGWGPWDL